MILDVTRTVMNLDVWRDIYRPLNNENHDISDAQSDCIGSVVRDVTGVEFECVNRSNRKTVWTLVSDDDGDLCLINGLHFYRRQGYVITQIGSGDERLQIAWDTTCEAVLSREFGAHPKCENGCTATGVIVADHDGAFSRCLCSYCGGTSVHRECLTRGIK